ncbi:MAG: hypothetical protein QOJ23_4796 [Actinomycetota bacterium]|nr:hypothetical protein [Actinomycetota bacterium]MDQ1500627.1 hypothetical protein [Actinomycetota bacterium]MDQ1565667.1 hypothetical protein [Actinomycetota bacterium]
MARHASSDSSSRPLIVRMSELTESPGAWLEAAGRGLVVVLRHGRPVAQLHPATEALGETTEATYFSRHAKELIDAAASRGPMTVTRYGNPHVVIEALRIENFDGLVLGHAVQLLKDIEVAEKENEVVFASEVGRRLGLTL